MAISLSDRVVVFDYGEVISVSPSPADRAEIERVASRGIPTFDAAAFWARYWAHRDKLDQGTLAVTAYWRTLEEELGASWSLGDLQELWAQDFRSWISVEPGTVDLIGELADGGTRMALLSNAGFDFVSPLGFSPIGRLFERVFVSAELDSIKPDPAIYEHVVSELGITLEQLVFVDNKSVNTDAAAQLGATVHHFTGVAGLREFLEALAG